MNKKLLAIGIILVFLIVGLSGCTQQSSNNGDNGEDLQVSEIEIYNSLMDNKIGLCTISEIFDGLFQLGIDWNSTQEIYGEYAEHLYRDIWEVGLVYDKGRRIDEYDWYYNVITDFETPISEKAKNLYGLFEKYDCKNEVNINDNAIEKNSIDMEFSDWVQQMLDTTTINYLSTMQRTTNTILSIYIQKRQRVLGNTLM